MKLIIPMSGQGKRFVEAGYTIPKPLLPIDGKPIIEHVVNLFSKIDEIIFIVNDYHVRTTDLIDQLKRIAPLCKIIQVPVGSKAGPVDAVSESFEFIEEDEEIIVSYCDYGTVWDFDKFLKDARDTNADGSIACYRGFHPHMLGTDNYAFVREKEQILLEIREKQSFTSDRMSEYASNGTYYFKSGKILKKYFNKMLAEGVKINNEFYVSLVYNFLVQDSLRVNIFEIDKMLQWGTPKDYEDYLSWLNYFKKHESNSTKASNPPETRLILPMAGKGSRFSMQGYRQPKPLLPINNQPMFICAVNDLPKCERFDFVALAEHQQKYDLRSQLERHYPKNYTLTLLNEMTNGQACTCEIAMLEQQIDLEKPIMISASDNGVLYNEEEYQRIVDNPENDIIVWSFRNNQASLRNPDMYAWLDVDEHEFVKHVSCKKFIYKDPLKTHAIIGTMFFRKAKYFLEALRENYSLKHTTNGEYYVDDVLNRNIANGLRVKVFEVEKYVCWGTPDDYRTYNYWEEHFVK